MFSLMNLILFVWYVESDVRFSQQAKIWTCLTREHISTVFRSFRAQRTRRHFWFLKQYRLIARWSRTCSCGFSPWPLHTEI